jgi:hypothetical protein
MAKKKDEKPVTAEALVLQELFPMEKSRTYHFRRGSVTLNNVTHFLARSSGTHRLQTKDGKLHIISKGWLHIEIDAESFTV